VTVAGDLRERIRFEQRGIDADGNRLDDWDAANGITRAARIFFRQGTEPVLQQRLQGVQPVEITVYSDSQTRTVTTGWRAVNTRTGQAFNIRAPAPSEDHAFITFGAVDDGSGGGA
jgi:hypothetical protein